MYRKTFFETVQCLLLFVSTSGAGLDETDSIKRSTVHMQNRSFFERKPGSGLGKTILLFVMCLSLAASNMLWAQKYIVSVAGNGVFSYSGDGGPAVDAQLHAPSNVTLDTYGNIYIADQYNDRIRKVTTSGTITTTIGTGVRGFAGDGGPASNAQLNRPSDIVMDGLGNFFIADRYNNRIRRVAPDGTITTIAGTGAEGYSGDGRPAINAVLNNPVALAVDASGAIYVADRHNNSIRKISADGIISTFAGTGEQGYGGDGGPATSAKMSLPEGIAVDKHGNVFFSENNRVRRVGTDGIITTVAGSKLSLGFSGDGGPATSAELGAPGGIAVDDQGNLFIVDTRNYRIRKVDSNGIITTIAGTGERGFSGDGGPATSAAFDFSGGAGIETDALGNLYVSDAWNYRLRKLDTEGITSTLAGNGITNFDGDGEPATNAQMSEAEDVAIDAEGNIYIADTWNNRIRKVTTDGTIRTIAGTGEFGYSGDGSAAINAQLKTPKGVAVDHLGNVYIADNLDHRIRKISTDGTITSIAGTGVKGYNGDGGPAENAQLNRPVGLAVDAEGNLYVADQENHRIRKISTAGTISTVAGNGQPGFNGDINPATASQLRMPAGVAVDAAGNIYIADQHNHRIRKVEADGTIKTIAGKWQGFDGDGGPATLASLNFPADVTVGKSGTIFFTDKHNFRVRAIDLEGNITTIAGTGERGFGGDGGFAISALLNYPVGIAIDASENIYLADPHNFRIRKLSDALAEPVKANPDITFTNETRTYSTASFSLTASSNSTGAITYEILEEQTENYPGDVTLSGTGNVLVTVERAGKVKLMASVAEDDQFLAGTAQMELTITKALAVVLISELDQEFSGAPVPVTIATEPAGLPVEVSYDGAAAVPVEAGAYAVHAVVVDDNYTGEASATLTINVPTALPDAKNSNNIIIYPNPTTGKAWLSLENSTAAVVLLLNVFGKVIEQAVVDSQYELNLENWPAGIYLVRVLQKGKAPVTVQLLRQ